MNIGFLITGGVPNKLKSLVKRIHATNPYVGLFDNLKKRGNSPSGGSNKFKESYFVGSVGTYDANFQLKILLLETY
jgi:hypothetical protein